MARFLLIHGALGGAWCWDRVAPGLQAAGHTVRAISLPGQGGDSTPVSEVTLDRYADAVCDALAAADGPTLLTAHSMGGMTITQAAARTPELLSGLIYVSAFLPHPGQSLLDIGHLPESAGESLQTNLVISGDPPVATLPDTAAPEVLYHCATREQVNWALPQHKRQPLMPSTQPLRGPEGPGRVAAFAGLPRAYVSCLQDRAVMPTLQRRMYKAAACDPVVEIDTDHSPWLSRSEELVAALVTIASHERFTAMEPATAQKSALAGRPA